MITTWYRFRVVLTAVVLVVLVPGFGGMAYAQDFDPAEYEIFSGDVNNDGNIDLLFLAERRIIIVTFDILIPVVIGPKLDTFAVLSDNPDGYYIDLDPAQSLIEHSAWTAGTHNVLLGDVTGSGSNELLVVAQGPDSTAALIGFDVSGNPFVLQDLSSAAVGVDLGATGTVVELRDSNGDGRDDLYIRVEGLLQYLVLANTSGQFDFPDDDQSSVYLTWSTFCASLDDGDVASALNQIYPRARENYDGPLNGLGAGVQNVTATWSNIKEVSTTDRFAEYTVFQQTENGQRMHFVTFMKDGDQWYLLTF